jgi:hypothetical protein
METERPDGASPPPNQGTGDARVDEAIAGLSRLREAPLDEHPPLLQAVHERLREILGELDEAGGSSPARPARPGEHGQQGQLGR